jgi:hypothetical protein
MALLDELAAAGGSLDEPAAGLGCLPAALKVKRCPDGRPIRGRLHVGLTGLGYVPGQPLKCRPGNFITPQATARVAWGPATPLQGSTQRCRV